MQPNTVLRRNRFATLARLGLILALLFVLPAQPGPPTATAAPASADAATAAIPAADLLNPDGTLDTSRGVNGTIDLRGWNVTLDSVRGPILSPSASAPAAPNASPWSALAHDGLNEGVNALAVIGTDLYVGGFFGQTADGAVTNLNYIAKYSGGAWSALANNGLDSVVYALAVSGSDLYVGGAFSRTADGAVKNLNYIAKYSGGAWSALANNGLSSTVRAIAVMGSDLYVGGNFSETADGAVTNLRRIAKYSGGAWSALANIGLNNTVLAFAVMGSDLYVGGAFSQTADGAVKNLGNIAKYSGGVWSALANKGLSGTVEALAVMESDLYVGGGFTQTADGAVTNLKRIAKYSGGAWSALANNGLNSTVRAIAVMGTDLYVGGDFDRTADGALTNLNRIAKYSGGAWSALANNGLSSTVRAIAVMGSDLYVGGNFSQTADGAVTNLNRIAKWGEVAPAVCTASGSGDWSAPATWSCGHVPGPGEKVVIPAGFTVTLDADITLDSDLEVAGTLVPNGKTVTLTGDQPQTVKGSPPNMTFYNLVVNKTNTADVVTIEGKLKVTKKLTITKGKLKSASDYEDIEIGPAGTLELTSDITVGGNFTIISGGTFTPNGFRTTFDGAKTQNVTLGFYTDFEKVTVAAGTVLVETDPSDSFFVSVELINNGVIQKTQTIDAMGTQYFGLAGRLNSADVELYVTTDNFTNITVERRDQNHAGRTGSAPPANGVGWGIYWTITPVGTGTVNLTLPHNLAGTTQACRFVSGTTWDCARTSSTANTITRNGVSTFSDWAVGNNVGPTAVTLTAFRAAPQFDLAAWLADLLRRLGVAR